MNIFKRNIFFGISQERLRELYRIEASISFKIGKEKYNSIRGRDLKYDVAINSLIENGIVKGKKEVGIIKELSSMRKLGSKFEYESMVHKGLIEFISECDRKLFQATYKVLHESECNFNKAQEFTTEELKNTKNFV